MPMQDLTNYAAFSQCLGGSGVASPAGGTGVGGRPRTPQPLPVRSSSTAKQMVTHQWAATSPQPRAIDGTLSPCMPMRHHQDYSLLRTRDALAAREERMAYFEKLVGDSAGKHAQEQGTRHIGDFSFGGQLAAGGSSSLLLGGGREAGVALADARSAGAALPPVADGKEAGRRGQALVDSNLGDDDDHALQEAIRLSLQEAEEMKRQEEERRRQEEEDALTAIALAGAAAAKAAKDLKPLPPPPGLAETFLPNQWLTDASISCAYTRLDAARAHAAAVAPGKEVFFSDLATQKHPGLSDKVLLMDPATAFWLTVQDDPEHVREAIEAMKLPERELVLCPINDNCDGSLADGGTHWALLVCWDRQHGFGGYPTDATKGGLFSRFTYYDSLDRNGNAHHSTNFAQAKTLASRLAGRPVQVSVGACARQTNSFDCGVYVLLFSEIVANMFLSTPTRPPAGLSIRNEFRVPVWEERLAAVTPEEVAAHRAQYLHALQQEA